jgi:hypothetical protein
VAYLRIVGHSFTHSLLHLHIHSLDEYLLDAYCVSGTGSIPEYYNRFSSSFHKALSLVKETDNKQK